MTVQDNVAFKGGNSIALEKKGEDGPCFAVRFKALASAKNVSKAALDHDGFYFRKGDDLWLQASYYLEPTDDMAGVFLMDIQ